MSKKPPPENQTKKPPGNAEIELLPDAWERFEKAVDRVAKSPPQHRHSSRRAKEKGKGGGS